PEVVLENQARFLVLLHAAGAIVLVGASTHHFLVSLGYLRGRYKIRLGRIYALIVALAYVATVVLGALAYPTFRYHVRGLFLDRYAVWASNLFEMKENLAAVGLPLAVAACLMSRVMNPAEDRHARVRYAALVFVQTAIVWFNVVSGLLITMVRGV
ncbi:MAG TPA: hypothetical protein VFP10_12605, partial [Candidatus Eisenbacteria bacterium]|nr:hypothetical protein [Candidatus Eisenbacteria bacterium]